VSNKAVNPSGGTGGFRYQRFSAAAGLPWSFCPSKMTHLRPKADSQYMIVEEIVGRATGEFRFTHCDQKRGLRYVTERLLKSMPGLSHSEKEQALLPVSDSIEMIVGDDQKSDDDFLKCYVIPNEPIVIEYVYDGHADRVEPLLIRLATSLGYEICQV
jgi:hypothetical protein